MRSSPEDRGPVLRGDSASGATTASFRVDLRRGVPADSAPVERAKQEGRTAGYAEGWAQGQRAAALTAQAAADQAAAQAAAQEQEFQACRQAALQQGVTAIARAVAGIESQRVPLLAELQELVLSHAVELAEAILGRELAEPQGRGTDALRRALAVAPEQGEVTVRLSPDDYRTLMGSATDADYSYEGRPVHLRPDPALRPGDAAAEVGFTTVDATIAAAVRRAREALDQ